MILPEGSRKKSSIPSCNSHRWTLPLLRKGNGDEKENGSNRGPARTAWTSTLGRGSSHVSAWELDRSFAYSRKACGDHLSNHHFGVVMSSDQLLLSLRAFFPL